MAATTNLAALTIILGRVPFQSKILVRIAHQLRYNDFDVNSATALFSCSVVLASCPLGRGHVGSPCIRDDVSLVRTWLHKVTVGAGSSPREGRNSLG